MLNQLYYVRKRRGLSQQELAERASVSRTTVYLLERSGGIPSVKTGVRLCRALDCDFQEVFPIDLLL